MNNIVTYAVAEIGYIVKFYPYDGFKSIEEHFHNTLQDAFELYRLFDSSDSDVYAALSIVERDYVKDTERIVAFKSL